MKFLPFFSLLTCFATNIQVSSEFLYFFASQETTSVWSSDYKLSETCSNFREKDVSFPFSPGFRIGLGNLLSYDDWDIELKWTWLRSKTQDTTDSKVNIVLPEFFCGYMNGDIADSQKVSWSILTNVIDLELGKKINATDALTFRPLVGLKGGAIRQSIHSAWSVYAVRQNNTISEERFVAKESLRNNFWGIGPMGGVNSSWKMGPFFSLLGDITLGTLWGNWTYEDVYENPRPKTICINLKDSSLGALMLQGFFGVGFSKDFGPTKFSSKLGYEMQLWFSQAQFPTFQQLCVRGDLTLQGVTLNCRFDY